jgi:hypothetical protein
MCVEYRVHSCWFMDLQAACKSKVAYVYRPDKQLMRTDDVPACLPACLPALMISEVICSDLAIVMYSNVWHMLF